MKKLTSLLLGLVVCLTLPASALFAAQIPSRDPALSSAADILLESDSSVPGATSPTTVTSSERDIPFAFPSTHAPKAVEGATDCAELPNTLVFWDVAPRTGTVAMIGDQQVVQPGPEDEVRVIIMLEGLSVAEYKSQLQAVSPSSPDAQSAEVINYAEQVQASQQRLLSEMTARDIPWTLNAEYTYLLNGMAISVQMADIEQIVGMPQVESVSPDYQAHALLTESVPLIGADQVWALHDAQGRPVTGHDMRVAVLDTGIDYTHPDLGGCFGPGCKVMDGYDFVNNDPDPLDDHGHGTHCAGIVAANGAVHGVAPDARLYAYKVLDQYGSGYDSTIITAIERATNPDDDLTTDDAVDVISMSLGGGGDPDEPLALAVDQAVDEGVVVVVAAGNSGAYQTIGSPGVARKAFTVGATDKSDNIASFSSRGPVTDFYQLVKPDIVAPGVSILSTVPPSGQLGDPSRYTRLNGTSMATPHIAGAAALIKQLHPGLAPDKIQAMLMNTARDLGLDAYTQGAGRAQVQVAAQAKAAISPGSVGFGRVDAAQPRWTRDTTLELTNLDTTSANYALQAGSGLPAGVTVQLNPANLTLPPGSTATIRLSIEVDNALLPYQTQEPGSYEGQIVVHPSNGPSLVVPFTFIKRPSLRLTFDEEPWIVLVHDGNKIRGQRNNPGKTTEFLLPPGSYDLWVVYNDAATWVVKEGISVQSAVSLSIKRSEAARRVTLVPRDKDGISIAMGDRTFAQQFKHTPSGISIGITSWGQPALQRFFSSVSSQNTWAWRLDTAWAGAWYEFNDRHEGIAGDITYQNDPVDLRHLTYRWHTTPDQPGLTVRPWLSSKPYG